MSTITMGQTSSKLHPNSSSSTSSAKLRTDDKKKKPVTNTKPLTESKKEESKPTEVVPYHDALGEAWPENAANINLSGGGGAIGRIILDYLAGDIDDKRYTSAHLTQFSLFGISGLSLIAPRQAAEFMLSVDFNKAETLVAQDPSILTRKIAAVKDPHGRTLVNTTLFRATAAARAFNPREMKAGEKNYGLLERFAERLSQAEVINQMNDQFPPGWEAETTKRMKRYIDAVTAFGEAIINTIVPENSSVTLACKAAIENYHVTLKAIASEEVISTGLIFDISPVLAARDYYAVNFGRFGDTNKRAIFLTKGYVPLLFKVASGDDPIIRHEIYNVIVKGELPPEGKSSSSGDYAILIRAFLHADALGDRVVFEDFMSNKNRRIAKLMQVPDTWKASKAVIRPSSVANR